MDFQKFLRNLQKIGQTLWGARPNQVGKIYESFKNFPSDILKFDNVINTLHPTQKPVDLLEYLIKTYSNETETVLDFTMGSGSTGVACKLTNRNFIGIELDDKYFDIAKKRIENDYTKEQIKSIYENNNDDALFDF